MDPEISDHDHDRHHRSLDGASSRVCVSTLITPEPWQRPQVTGPAPGLAPRTMTGMTASLPMVLNFFFCTKIASSNLGLTRYWRSSPWRGAFGITTSAPPPKKLEKMSSQSHQPAPSKPPNHLLRHRSYHWQLQYHIGHRQARFYSSPVSCFLNFLCIFPSALGLVDI